MTKGRFEHDATGDRPVSGQDRPERLTLTPSQRLELMLTDATQRARAEVGRHRNWRIRVYKIRGRCSEILAHESHCGSLDLNDVCHWNYPVYDLADSQAMMSVKTRASKKDGSPPVESYAHDLRVAIGAIPRPSCGRYEGKTGTEIAAEQLLKLKQSDPQAWQRICAHLPADVTGATDVRTMAAAMEGRARLLVPADHVAATRMYIQHVAQLHPEKYGLPSTLAPEELTAKVAELSQRVQPIRRRISSFMIDQYSRRILPRQQKRA